MLEKKASRNSSPDEGCVPFAWRGIYVALPRSWSPGVIEDRDSSGYIRIDDREVVRMELRWDTMKPTQTTSVEKTLESIERTAGKQDQKIEVERNLPWRLPQEIEGEILHVAGDWNVYHLLASHEQRAIHLQVMGAPDEDISGTARSIFESLKLSRGRKTRWVVFGLDASIPADYKFEKHSLVAGQIELCFIRGTSWLTLQRFSLANNLVGDTGLEKWVRERHPKLAKAGNITAEKTDVRSHPAVHLSAECRSWLRAFRKPRLIDVTAWICDTMDKLFLLTLEYDTEEDLEAIVRAVHCH